MGVSPHDWARVESVCSTETGPVRCFPFFGVHPWFVERLAGSVDEAMDSLRSLLLKNPAANVGEIGLDRVAVHPETRLLYDFEQQKALFRAQFALAGQLNRVVSVHVVQSFGFLMPFLTEAIKNRDQQPLPRAVVLHSFSGKPGTVDQLLSLAAHRKQSGLRLYFGFSACINMRSPKLAQVISRLPEHTILLETDLNSPEDMDECADQIATLIAQTLGKTLDETKSLLLSNAKSLFLT